MRETSGEWPRNGRELECERSEREWKRGERKGDGSLNLLLRNPVYATGNSNAERLR